MKCKICDSDTEEFGRGSVMGKHAVRYLRCRGCGFIFIEDPYWLREAYSNAITSTDLGTVSRTDRNSLMTKAVVDLFFRSAMTFLDYGAGYGMFVRRMRDLGYDFHAHDLYCENLFSKDFAVHELAGRHFDFITAFEVFEHLANPVSEIKTLLSHGDHLLFSTELLPEPAPRLCDWWYYAPEHGQHLSFFTFASLERLAARNNRFLCTNGKDLHVFSKEKVNERLFRKLVTVRKSQWLSLLTPRRSLLEDDWHKLRRRVLTNLGYSPEQSSLR